jgi:serine phosphatase RsbU (regulator of sigma subunit)/anti-sigma regulatory factor (Ser/Thr protein kinase)
MCFAWQSNVLLLHVASDALIALAYFSIPVLLVRFAERRSDLPFKPVFWMFGVFIVACGTTHVLAIWVIWYPTYWLEGGVKALTAAASLATAVALVPLIPKALALRSPRELEALNGTLEKVNRTLEDALADLAREQRVANRFQTAAMVKDLPQVDGFVLSGYYDSATTDLGVGGDWYDAFTLADGRIVLTVGDVAGKGLDASILMAKVRQSLRTAAAIHIEPGAILDAADRTLRVEYPDAVVTAFVGIVDRIEETFVFANAGHPWPFLRRARGTIDELRSIALPLGLRDVGTPETQTTPFRRNEMLVLYTDGLVEATHDVIAGEARLRAAIAELDPSDEDGARTLVDRMLTDAAIDDVAVIVVSCTDDLAPSQLLRRSVASDDGHAVGAVRAEIVRALRLRGASESDMLTAELIFSELIGNVYRYAPGTAEIVLDLSGAQPVLHVLDTGDGFQHVARLPSNIFSENGRGLFLVASLSDDFHIMRRPGGGSHARVVLRLPIGGRLARVPA